MSVVDFDTEAPVVGFVETANFPVVLYVCAEVSEVFDATVTDDDFTCVATIKCKLLTASVRCVTKKGNVDVPPLVGLIGVTIVVVIVHAMLPRHTVEGKK